MDHGSMLDKSQNIASIITNHGPSHNAIMQFTDYVKDVQLYNGLIIIFKAAYS